MKLKRRFCALLLALALALGCVSGALAEQEEPLPTEWNLEEIYPDVEAWQADYDTVMEMLNRYEEFRGTLNSAEAIYNYLQFSYLTELTRVQSKLYLYAHLGSSLNPVDPVFTGLQAQLDNMEVTESQLSAFASPEIYDLPLEKRVEIFADPLFADAQYWVRDYTDPDAQPYSEEILKLLSTLSIGNGYASQVFDILDSVELPDPVITMPDGTEQKLTDELYDDIVYSDEYDDAFKAEANQLILTRPKPFINTLAALLEENTAQAYASAQINHFDTTREAALSAYDVDPALYDMLIEAAHEGAADYRRYLNTHARGLGLTEQRPYNMGTYVSDFYPGQIAYEDAVKDVTQALSVLGEEYIDTFTGILRSGHVDVYPTETKTPGAFETQPSLEYLPYVLFNYNGYSSDVSTIAHEMGHAVYSAFSSQNQPAFYGSPTIFTQEVASTANELLYYTYKMNTAADDDEKLYYLENLLSMFSGTFFVQMWYAEFEDYVYKTVEAGLPLNAEDLSEKWMELVNLYREGAIISYPDARYQWSTIPHFYYVYYVYQYAADVCYAASIAERITTGEEGAAEEYIGFLKLGNSAPPVELLSQAGVDPLSEETYRYALSYFSGLVDEYERLVDAKLAAGAEPDAEDEPAIKEEPAA